LNDKPTYLQTLASGTEEILKGRCEAQAAAICYRGVGVDREVLLITSRDTGRWVLPKGNVEKKENARQAAVRESREEAGISGKVSKKAFGSYTYIKGREGLPCVVDVFLLETTNARNRFPEADQRRLEWVSSLEAARRVDEPGLKALFRLFASVER
jgi:8-oxo-dGTP pyrophosphatase MutT (NUDIX family)